MMKVKVKLHKTKEGVKANVSFRVTKKQSIITSQIELVALILGYRDTVLEDMNNEEALKHIKETVNLVEEELMEKEEKTTK